MGSVKRPSDEADLPGDMKSALDDLRARYAACPDAALLQAAQAGVLPPEIGATVMRHIGICPFCQSLAQSLSGLDDSPLQMEERQRIWNRIQAGAGLTEVSASRPRANWWRLLLRPWPSVAVAAALVLAFIVAGLLRERREPMVAVSRPPDAQEPAPASKPLPLEKAPVLLPPAALLVWRGEGEGEGGQWKELLAALEPYQAGDYAAAARRLKSSSKKYPRLGEARFYLGVCELFLNSDADAAADLEAAHGNVNPRLTESAAWYLAIADQRVGKIQESRALLENLCQGSGSNSAKACAGLQDLRVIK